MDYVRRTFPQEAKNGFLSQSMVKTVLINGTLRTAYMYRYPLPFPLLWIPQVLCMSKELTANKNRLSYTRNIHGPSTTDASSPATTLSS